MKHAFLTSLVLFFASSCNPNRTPNKETNVADITSVVAIAEAKETKICEHWDFIIDPPRVGRISTKNRISEISALLPSNYSIVKDSVTYDYGDSYWIFYAVRKGNKTVFEINPKENTDEIATIVILSPEYKIKDTELRVGSTLGTLKKTFSVESWEFTFDFGLYIFCSGFNGAFLIDLERQGSDEPNLLELLPHSKKIETIVIYR